MSNNPGAGFVDRGIVIADGIVQRPRGYWSDAVHDLLRWLDRAGFGLSPKPAGLDERYEYLRYIKGTDQGWPLLPFIQGLDGARAAGTFARKLESILATYRPTEETRWQLDGGTHALGPIQHGDVGPWNLLWDSARGEICGLIDWDLAGPAPDGYDAGFLAWFIVPMMDDLRAHERGFDTPIDRAGRLQAYCEGYGITPAEMLDLIVSSQEEFGDRILAASENDPPTYATLKEAGIADQVREDNLFTKDWKDRAFEPYPRNGRQVLRLKTRGSQGA